MGGDEVGWMNKKKTDVDDCVAHVVVDGQPTASDMAVYAACMTNAMAVVLNEQFGDAAGCEMFECIVGLAQEWAEDVRLTNFDLCMSYAVTCIEERRRKS
jgi:hypothetical protein